MDTINWLLVNVATALLWLWEEIKTIFVDVFAAVDVVANPILSPILSFLNPPCTAIADACYAVLSPLPVWLGLSLISVIAGIVMLFAFGRLSNQDAISDLKDEIKANLLALKLFKDELHVTWQAQVRLLWAIVRLQRYMLVPVLVLSPPMLLGLAQMGVRYQWRPLHPGEQALIKLKLDKHVKESPLVTLENNPGVDVEVGPVPGAGEYAWRIRGGEPGRHTLKFQVGKHVIEKELVVGRGLERVSAERSVASWTAQLFHPVEQVISSTSPVESVTILYGARDSWIYGADYWILYFFVISMAAALVVKPVFGVKF